MRTMVLGAGAVGLCGCLPTSVYEKDVLAAKCVLVERMNVVKVVKSDEDFEIGVRCDSGESRGYHVVFSLAQSYEYAVLAGAPQQEATQSVELVHCVREQHDKLTRRVGQLNAMSSDTGFVFSLRPWSKSCEQEIGLVQGALTNLNSKPFDRQIK